MPEIGIGIEIAIRLRSRFRSRSVGVPGWLGTDHSSTRFALPGRAIQKDLPRSLHPTPFAWLTWLVSSHV